MKKAEKEVALKVGCPTCGAAAGEPCRYPVRQMKPMKTPHDQRLMKAKIVNADQTVLVRTKTTEGDIQLDVGTDIHLHFDNGQVIDIRLIPDKDGRLMISADGGISIKPFASNSILLKPEER